MQPIRMRGQGHAGTETAADAYTVDADTAYAGTVLADASDTCTADADSVQADTVHAGPVMQAGYSALKAMDVESANLPNPGC